MCQLTLIDIQDNALDNKFLHGLLSLNSIEGNLDGFGFYKFTDKLLFKTDIDYPQWFYGKSKEAMHFKKDANINGIYHVRYASTNKDNITAPTAHPHKLGNILLAHNGTFSKYYPKTLAHIFSQYDYKREDTTDSIEFLMALHYYSYGDGSSEDKCVSASSIEKALNLFSGSFVLLITDTSIPNCVYIVKDEKVKPLAIAKVFNGDTQIGCIFNSKWFMLESNIYIHRNVHHLTDLRFDVSDVVGNKIYLYNLDEHSLNEISTLPVLHIAPELDIIKPVVKDVSVSSKLDNTDSTIYLNLSRIIEEAYITMDDIFVLYEILFSKSLLSCTEDDISDFIYLLYTILDKSTNEKDILYSKLLSEFNGNRNNLYNKSKLQYPYMMNSKEDLEMAIASIHANSQEIQ